MAARTFDELKDIKKKVDESLVRKTLMDYFDEMDVDDVEQRTNMAVMLEKVLHDVLLLALVGAVSREEMIDQLIEEYSQVVLANGNRPNYAHIERVAEDLVDNTLDGIDEDYMTSTERFMLIAANETNNAANYSEFLEAIDEGRTEKTWHTMKDKKVRRTHVEVDEKTIGILENFIVGGAEMRFPVDEELAYDHPEETVNCRCTVTYQ